MIRAAIAALCLLVSGLVYPTDETPSDVAKTAEPQAAVTSDPKVEFTEAYHTYQQLFADGKYTEALPYAERAYQLGLSIYGDNHKSSAALALNYGDALLKVDQRKQAVEMLDTAISMYERVYGKDAQALIDPLMARGNASGSWEPEEQRKYYEQALDLVRRFLQADDLLRARLNLEAGAHLLQNGNADESRRYVKAAYDQYHKQLPATDARVGVAAFWLGKYEFANGDAAAAEPYFNQALVAIERDGVPPGPLVVAAHTLLVGVYQQLGDPARATPHCVAVGRLKPWEEPVARTPLYGPPPDYPAAAKGRDGYALVEFTIDAAGFVRDPKLLKTQGSDSFGEPALLAINNWRYAPRVVDGQPVDTPGVQAQVEFKLTL